MTYYEVWGYDTFACEAYFCIRSGSFTEGGQTTIFSIIRGTCNELIEWAKTKEAVQQCIEELEKLINHIYKSQR